MTASTSDGNVSSGPPLTRAVTSAVAARTASRSRVARPRRSSDPAVASSAVSRSSAAVTRSADTAQAPAARSLDPLSLEPVFAAARVAEQRRREVAALEAYREATRLQPKNPESWLQLGLYEFDIGDRCAAYRHLNEAYTLDPAGKQWTPGGPLVVSLVWVNAGNCD